MKLEVGSVLALSLALLGGLLISGEARGTPAAAADEAGARKAVELYLQGHATGNPEHFRAAFHTDMKMSFIRDGAFTQRTAAEYIAGVKGKPEPDEAQRKRRIVSLDVTGDVGVAKVELDYPGAFLTDYLTLIKVDGTWKIIHKTFHRRAG
jgi:hypothetical protein